MVHEYDWNWHDEGVAEGRRTRPRQQLGDFLVCPLANPRVRSRIQVVSETKASTAWGSPRGASLLRFARSLIVGSWGTALDFGALTLSIRAFGIDATWARVIGLCVGGVVLFFGSRSFAFRAQSESAVRQAQRFVV